MRYDGCTGRQFLLASPLLISLGTAGMLGACSPSSGPEGDDDDEVGEFEDGPGPDVGSGDDAFGLLERWDDVTRCAGGANPSFPGAEGWGACASGGRGGGVCYVTTTDADPSGTIPGSLQNCLAQEGPGYVLFRVGGVIHGAMTISRPDKTIAGQTAPGGITVRGIVCDNGIYEPRYRCHNIIMRHLRSRPGDGADDALRIDGGRHVIVDHMSLANATDETVQISRATYITIQNSILAEPIGDHYYLGGMLINYSSTEYPLDALSIHHNLFSRLGGRMPEISCEENALGGGERSLGPLDTNCSRQTNRIELISNLLWDQAIQVWYNECTGTNEGNPSDGDCSGHHAVSLNFQGNASYARSGYGGNVLMDELYESSTVENEVYAFDNRLNGELTELSASNVDTAHTAPSVSSTPSTELAAYMETTVGAFPRDPMDARLVAYLDETVDTTPRSYAGTTVNSDTRGLDAGDAYRLVASPDAPPDDMDLDGMPDEWEAAHGLDPSVADSHATTLSAGGGDGIEGCLPGYTDLECYLNELALRVARQ